MSNIIVKILGLNFVCVCFDLIFLVIHFYCSSSKFRYRLGLGWGGGEWSLLTNGLKSTASMNIRKIEDVGCALREFSRLWVNGCHSGSETPLLGFHMLQLFHGTVGYRELDVLTESRPASPQSKQTLIFAPSEYQ